MSSTSNNSGKPVSDSRVILSQLMHPQHANLLGNVHGGWIMKLADEAGALACMRHSHQRVVTVAVDQLTFNHPIRIGDLVTLTAEVSYTGTTSMEAEVQVTAENPMSGNVTHTNTAYLVYVALDEQGRSVPVPPIIPQTEREKRRFEHAKERQRYRLQQKKKVAQELVES
jgi:uncharacterized protein (TIGR00369 family)